MLGCNTKNVQEHDDVGYVSSGLTGKSKTMVASCWGCIPIKPAPAQLCMQSRYVRDETEIWYLRSI